MNNRIKQNLENIANDFNKKMGEQFAELQAGLTSSIEDQETRAKIYRIYPNPSGDHEMPPSPEIALAEQTQVDAVLDMVNKYGYDDCKPYTIREVREITGTADDLKALKETESMLEAFRFARKIEQVQHALNGIDDVECHIVKTTPAEFLQHLKDQGIDPNDL